MPMQEAEKVIARGPAESARVAGIGRTKVFDAIRFGQLRARMEQSASAVGVDERNIFNF